MRRTDAEPSVPGDLENSLPTWDPNQATAHAPGEIITCLGKLESTCPSFDCQQPNLIVSGPTKAAAACIWSPESSIWHFAMIISHLAIRHLTISILHLAIIMSQGPFI